MAKIGNIKTTAESIAERAFQRTAHYPCFNSADRYEAMMEVLRDSMEDLEQDVIAACRKKAGVK